MIHRRIMEAPDHVQARQHVHRPATGGRSGPVDRRGLTVVRGRSALGDRGAHSRPAVAAGSLRRQDLSGLRASAAALMTGGGGRRAQRWLELWPDHRAELLHAAHGVWQACIPAIRSLSTDGTDYRAVDRLQTAALAFSGEISDGVSWLHSSTTPAGLLPAISEGQAQCAGHRER